MRQPIASRYSRASREVAGRGSVLNPKFVKQEHCRKEAQKPQRRARDPPPQHTCSGQCDFPFSSEMHSAVG